MTNYKKREGFQVGDYVHFNEGAYIGFIGKITKKEKELCTVELSSGGSVAAYCYWLEARRVLSQAS